MAFRSFKHDFHDASLVSFTIGPRRDIELEIALDPVWNKIGKIVHVRFGNIRNFDDVKQFFESIPIPQSKDAYLAEIIGLNYEKNKPYPVILDLADVGDLVIKAGNVRET